MSSYRSIRVELDQPPRDRLRRRGFSFVEVLVSLGLGSIVLLILGVLSYQGLTSFSAMGNCAVLDDQNRLASDQISREFRQATRVLRYETNDEGKELVLTNSPLGYSINYIWSAQDRTVTCQKSDQPQFTCLKDCDAWEVAFFQSIPQSSVVVPFLPATNALGSPDLDQARLVKLSWKCSRQVRLTRSKNESEQSLQILLRNAIQP